MSKSVADTLREAKAIIQDPNNWCTGVLAQDQHGLIAPAPDSPDACRWCALGALAKVEGRFWPSWRPVAYLDEAAGLEWPDDSNDGVPIEVAEVNDRLGHEAVLRVYDKAIELAEKAGY